MFESRPQLEGNREGLDGDGRNMQRMIYESWKWRDRGKRHIVPGWRLYRLYRRYYTRSITTQQLSNSRRLSFLEASWFLAA
jgi:hypothetical protein